mmetsp:Transcript_3501/g.6761  ORF Transcript_3501/g.6761 Transcript_3501/m.6761 type:complete len:290 (-) Transcript_3501:244-1113(-)
MPIVLPILQQLGEAALPWNRNSFRSPVNSEFPQKPLSFIGEILPLGLACNLLATDRDLGLQPELQLGVGRILLGDVKVTVCVLELLERGVVLVPFALRSLDRSTWDNPAESDPIQQDLLIGFQRSLLLRRSLRGLPLVNAPVNLLLLSGHGLDLASGQMTNVALIIRKRQHPRVLPVPLGRFEEEIIGVTDRRGPYSLLGPSDLLLGTLQPGLGPADLLFQLAHVGLRPLDTLHLEIHGVLRAREPSFVHIRLPLELLRRHLLPRLRVGRSLRSAPLLGPSLLARISRR